MLVVNAVLTGGALISCAAFSPDTPKSLMIGALLIGGFFRSLQFTATNTLAYADIPQASMSRASSFAAMGQQLGISLGVGVAAATIRISLLVTGDTALAAHDIVPAFFVVGAFCMLAGWSFTSLPLDAGKSLQSQTKAP